MSRRKQRSRPAWLPAALVAALVLAVGGGTYVALSGDDDLGGSNEARAAAYREGQAKYEADYAAWVTSEAGLKFAAEVRKLPQAPVLALSVPGQPSLAAAVAAADVIVLGEVTAIRWAGHGSVTTFAVQSTAKGSAGPTLEFDQGIGLAPLPSYAEPSLQIGPATPALLPGDRAILLLETDPGGTLQVQPVSGVFVSRKGKVAAVKANRFRELDGLTEAAALKRIRAALKG